MAAAAEHTSNILNFRRFRYNPVFGHYGLEWKNLSWISFEENPKKVLYSKKGLRDFVIEETLINGKLGSMLEHGNFY